MKTSTDVKLGSNAMGQHMGRSNDRGEGEVIFSLLDGYVCVSWPDGPSMVRIGRYEAATAAMHDFLAQCELGERLVNGIPGSALDRSSGV